MPPAFTERVSAVPLFWGRRTQTRRGQDTRTPWLPFQSVLFVARKDTLWRQRGLGAVGQCSRRPPDCRAQRRRCRDGPGGSPRLTTPVASREGGFTPRLLSISPELCLGGAVKTHRSLTSVQMLVTEGQPDQRTPTRDQGDVGLLGRSVDTFSPFFQIVKPEPILGLPWRHPASPVLAPWGRGRAPRAPCSALPGGGSCRFTVPPHRPLPLGRAVRRGSNRPCRACGSPRISERPPPHLHALCECYSRRSPLAF